VEAEQYKSMGVSDEKIAIIPDGIDLSEYVDLPPKGSFKKKFGIDSDKKMILYLGRIHKIKGIDFLVRAYACLLKSMKDDNAILVLAGSDDGYLAGAKRLVASLKIVDKVVFTGMLTEKEKVSAYVDSSIVVNVEPINVFGLVPLEAAACATPVIVSNTNAISEIIDGGRFGFSVNYGDVNELARVMGKMLDNDDLSRKMGQNGRDFMSKNFSWNRIITSFEKVYKDAIEN
jgi:glycosyltransferase involved in cell wall biosynthesis